jgi:hypothetical protein
VSGFHPNTISALPLSRHDWQRHFRPHWGALVSAKRRYDRDGVLTHGPDIFRDHTSRRPLVKAPLIAALALSITMLAAGGLEAARPAMPPPDGPVAAVLAPVDGAHVNAGTLRVQALIAARKPDRHRTFVLDGTAVQGRNAGRVERVDVAIDDMIVAQVTAHPCRRQLVVDERVDLTGFADGPHTLRLTAYQNAGRNAREVTVATTFTLDRTLPVAESNRIEAAATPAPFACFAARDEDDDEDDDGAAPRHPDVHGRFVLGAQSDGLDFGRDRFVIAAGGTTLVLEPGILRCNRRERVCRFDDLAHPLVQRLVLTRVGDRIVRVRLRGGAQWPRDAVVHLRVGNDWGGFDLGSGERLGRTKLALDITHRAQATVGVEGGSVQTIAGGVTIRLDVPPGALTHDTVLSVTPLASSPVPGAEAAHPGVKLEPDGLQFRIPATLTYDFGTQPLPENTRLFLVTSPLTKLPAGGVLNGRVLAAALRHFSPWQPGAGAAPLTDRVAWANSALGSSTPMTDAEIQALLAVAADQQLAGCTSDCLDLAAISDAVEDSVAAAIASDCASPATTASRAALRRLLDLERAVQQVGGAVPTLLPCADAMLGALVAQLTGPPASTAPSDPFLVEAKDLSDTARSFALTTRVNDALGKLADGIRTVVGTLAAAAQAALGTPQESTVTQQASVGIQDAQLWVTTLAPEVVTIDSELPGFLQNALDALNATADMIVSFYEPVPFYGSTLLSLVSVDTSQSQPIIIPRAAAPATIALQGSAGALSASWSRPTPNSLALDATLSTTTPPLWGQWPVAANLWTKVTFTRSGTLTADLHADLFPPQTEDHQYYLPSGTREVGSQVSFLDPTDPNEARDIAQQTFNYAGCRQGGTLTYRTDGVRTEFNDRGPIVVNVVEGLTLYIQAIVAVHAAHGRSPETGADVVIRGSGSGRALTVTFTPGATAPPIIDGTINACADPPPPPPPCGADCPN